MTWKWNIAFNNDDEIYVQYLQKFFLAIPPQLPLAHLTLHNLDRKSTTHE